VTADNALDVSAVILTLGNRPAELRSAVDSVRSQTGVEVDIVLVANGVPASQLAALDDGGVRIVVAAENLGIPGGRNLGAAAANAPVLAFLDDDARLSAPDVLARCVEAFRSDNRLGVIALRIVDETGGTARRHVPRIGDRRADRSGPVTAFLGGAAVIRRTAFERAGGFAVEFRYAMEETDLALRLLDDGWTIHYDGVPAVSHPRTEPARHPDAAGRTMRNRVWLAYRNLPAPLAVAYVTNWFVISALRRPRQAGDLLRGVRNGWHTRPRGQRDTIRWHTVARLTRLGRPPIV
jgi:GT2 family glycosyltransferase